ncbi:alpha/beta hydrolase [Paucibacter sp. R3-3]|uniref:Alpha/beta hydrolase n=1 Tax=Roseateles agri TaxID=3098619 RepID=A0ABU5DPX6_9BURK|nr:alpha/beta hydrolase [Paucibacter sp. R3-3]MDY0748373.1 alpha/beta hydrolase [Paucibacter sp. R3-3]
MIQEASAPHYPDDDELRPDMRRFAQTLAAGYAAHPPLASVDLAGVRRITEAVRAPLAQGGPRMVRSDERSIDVPAHAAHGPLRLRVHRPSDAANLPALVYLHGGGWVFFSIDSHDRLMREIAARAGRIVIGVDYARAPEARFPVALEQAGAAWRWAREQAAVLGIDATRIALGGDSAGANLALATALDLRSQGLAPDALLLHYGCFSDDDSTDSSTRFDGPRFTLEREEMRGFWNDYLGPDGDRDSPRAMPLKADLRGLPRTCLVVPECDVLRDSSLALAAKLGGAGVPHALQRHAGAPHSFLEAVSFSPTADEAFTQCCAWLREGDAA